ncbi:MAG: glycosyltransferase family 9 protein [Bacteriovoracaceae bacterium]
MKNILIVNLDQDGDILLLASVIEALKKEQANVSILTLASHSETVKNLTGVEKTYLLQLEEILKYKKHRIFSDLEMLRELSQNLEPIRNLEWHEVINISSSEAAAYLVNCFKTKLIRGLSYTPERTLYSDSDMGIWTTGPTLFSERERQNDLSGRKIENLGTLQGNSNHLVENAKTFIGIELTSASQSHHLNLNILSELIQKLKLNPKNEVKVIYSAEDHLEKLLYELSDKLQGQLEVIESSKIDLSSLVSSFHLILTSSADLKTAAEINQVKTLALWTNLKILYRQRSGVNSLNLYVSTDGIAVLKGESLATIMETQLSGKNGELTRLPKGLEIYQTKEDGMMLPLSLAFNQAVYMKMIMEKALWKETHYQSWIDLKKYLSAIPDKELSQFIGQEKEALSVVVKSTLSAIRFLKNHEQGPNQVKELMATLDLLMNKRMDGATYFLLNMFKHKMEHLAATSKEDTLIKTEKALIILKNQLSTLTKILGDMAETINERRKLPSSKSTHAF